MHTHFMRALLMTLALGAASVGVRTEGAQTLVDLRSVAELKALFNHDVGRVRLVLLVSPT